MKMPSVLRAALVALVALSANVLSSTAHADSGFVSLVIYKAGWVIGGSGGSGTEQRQTAHGEFSGLDLVRFPRGNAGERGACAPDTNSVTEPPAEVQTRYSRRERDSSSLLFGA